jgi:hypothetical protein
MSGSGRILPRLFALHELFSDTLKACAVALLMAAILFSGTGRESALSFLGAISREAAGALRDEGTQWMVFLCVAVYYTAFILIRSQREPFWQTANPEVWLGCLLLISTVHYAADYSASKRALTFLGSAALGQGAAVWASLKAENGRPKLESGLRGLVVSILVVLLALASVSNWDSGRLFEYRNHRRRFGPWDNPNLSGSLMGVGMTLAFGLLVRNFIFRGQGGDLKGRTRSQKEKCLIVPLCIGN